MRSLSRFAVLALLIVAAYPAAGQGARPNFRPAVLGTGPDSLVNRIDTKDLIQKGQKDGTIMFCAQVSKTGEVKTSWTYRGSPETQALEQEVSKRLEGGKFTPAIYNYQPVDVLLFATVWFSTQSPHLRIFLNQDPAQLKEAKDFIAPQPVFGQDSKFTGLHFPSSKMPVELKGFVALDIKVDASGIMKNLQVRNEEPPLYGYGAAALEDFRDAKFIPAFRDGDAAEVDTVLTICYRPVPGQ